MTILDEFNELNYTGESTDSNIKILLNLRENGYLDFGDYGFDFDDLEDMFVDYINRETEELNEGDVWDLLDKEDFTDSQAIYMMLEELEDLSFISSHYHLVRASRLFALQYKLREDIDGWCLELKDELDVRFNKLIALWKTRKANKPRLCLKCSTPYVKDQTFENHNEQGDWMCKDCWVNEVVNNIFKIKKECDEIVKKN